MVPSGAWMPSGYETRRGSSSNRPLLQVWPSSVERKAVRLERRGRRTSSGPFLTKSKLPDARRRMKKRALTFWIKDGCGGLQVAPWSDEKLSLMPFFVRASIHKRPSLSSTDHVLVEVGAGEGNTAAPRPRLTCSEIVARPART